MVVAGDGDDTRKQMAQVSFPYNTQVYIDPRNYNVPVYGNDPTSDYQSMENFADLPLSVAHDNAVLARPFGGSEFGAAAQNLWAGFGFGGPTSTTTLNADGSVSSGGMGIGTALLVFTGLFFATKIFSR